ncbi:MAG: PAS domain S-box protein, partial [Nitriliruptoraceae bacterium]
MTGALWMLGSGPVADAVTQIASIPRWVVQVGTGMVFVTVTTVALQAAVRRHADRWDAAAMSTDTTTPLPIAGRSRDRLPAAALSATASAVVITGIDGTIEWVNPAFEAMSGYPSSVAVGATPGILNSGLQDEAFFRDLWETIIAGKVWRGQLVNRRSDGELYTESQTITPVVGERGEVKHFVAISEDISERVRAEHALEMSRLRLQSLFEHAIDAIVLADDEGHYIEVNPAVSELTGYTRDELLRMQPADLATPDQQPADVATQFDDFMRAGSKSGAFALRHKDGRVVETEYRTVSNIQPGVHLSVLRDVTTRNRMLRALALAENEFRELAEKAADIVAKLHVDTDGLMQIDYINPAASTILGYPREHFYHDPDLLLTLFHGRSEDLEDALDLLPTPAEPTRLA